MNETNGWSVNDRKDRDGEKRKKREERARERREEEKKRKREKETRSGVGPESGDWRQ